MSVKAHCPKCGKDHEMDDKYAGFVAKHDGVVECPECKFGKSTKKSDASKGQAKDVVAKKRQPITPERYHKRYEEFKAEFGEEFDEVKDMVATWITTTLLDENKN